MPYADREEMLSYNREYYRRNREKKLRYASGHYLSNTDRIRGERPLKRDAEFKTRHAADARIRYRLLRAEVIAAYGSQCSCCGESESIFLELDHRNGDGANHRKRIGRGSTAIYQWARKHGFPKDILQLHCANCNQGKVRNGGICPHRQR